jgi:anti-sigma B factor antagonist
MFTGLRSPGTSDSLDPGSIGYFSNGMAGNFSTEVAQTGDTTVIYVRGEIDIATCERLRDAIEPHLGPRQSVILDLARVEFIDSSGLHVLEQARGALTADGGSLVLRNPSEAAHRLLTVTQTEELLEAEADDHPG